MKINGKQILALFVLHPEVWNINAFSIQSSKAHTASGLKMNMNNDQMTGYNSRGAFASDSYSTVSPMQGFSPLQGVTPLSGGPMAQTSTATASTPKKTKALAPVTIQGDSLETWSFSDPRVKSVQVFLKTSGRPMNSNVELWHGPNNTPMKVAVYIEDGSVRPFNMVIATPRGPSAVAVYNTASMEMPITACVEADEVGIEAVAQNLMSTKGIMVQGGSIQTYPFDSMVESVQILLRTDGRPLNARIELLQGPNNKKQLVEVYSEDGMDRPVFLVLETPGNGNVIRLVNTATMEYPLSAVIQPYTVRR